ncbi:hypothetical protein DITRI_Ditri04bG0019700 [Diplodiscus trichospermus]
MSSILCSPKLLFLVGNLIVFVLIGESKYFASGSSFSGDVFYDEYIDGSRNLRNSWTLEMKKEKKMKHFEENVKMTCLLSVSERVGEEIREVKKQKNGLEGEHELILPTEELKKRADDFIARINRQRRLEARSLN